MRDAIDQYLDEVLSHASLARGDQGQVRAELRDHLEELTAEARKNSSTPKEILAMLKSEFGEPEAVGGGIARAKGRLRTYFKKQKRRLPIKLAIGSVLVVSIRWAVAQSYYVPGIAVTPDIPQGSRILVYKLVSAFHPGDIIVLHNLSGEALLGIVKSDNGSVVIASRNGEADREVPHTRVVGRVVANTR